MSIRVEHLVKRFGSFAAVDDVSFTVEPGNLVALLGPSGSGKSTILRMIAGLEQPDSGHVYISDEQATGLSVQKRNVGFVFQHYALFRHMTVFENVAFGLRVRKVPRKQVTERVNTLLKLVQLEGFAKRYPSQLSGGQRQRVALARALAPEPRVLLLDEPFGALDSQVRVELREWLRRLHDEVHVTSIFVTHDQEEALEISDQIVVLHKGKVEQFGTPQEVYENPATPFVMGFIGPVNEVQGAWGTDGDGATAPAASGTSRTALIRPTDIAVRKNGHAPAASTPAAADPSDRLPAAAAEAAASNGFGGRLDRVRYLGSVIKLEIVLPDAQRMQVHLSRDQFKELDLQRGDWVSLEAKQPRIFHEDYSI
jgi:sulfate/thiosulfate transport system ATP-binding protein